MAENQGASAAVGSAVTALEQSLLKNVSTGGDINVQDITQIGSQTIIHQDLSTETNFFEPNLKGLSSSQFPTPSIAESLLDVLKNQHFLVLGDGADVDKPTLARKLALILSEELPSSTGQDVHVKEWYGSSDPRVIEIELDRFDQQQILILPQLNPQKIIGYSLSNLKDKAAKTNQFIIVTTDSPFAAWRLLESCKEWWVDLSSQDFQDCKRLISDLSKEEEFSVWYYQRLDPREQLLVIGLGFFDGLFDDQFFAALEEVVLNAWKNRDANLRALDYCDLDNLRNYFDFIETDNHRDLVRIKFSQQRLIGLKIAWRSHRRQILSALPILVKLVKNSTTKNNGELYALQVRREKIRQVISDAISEIGLISRLASREAVEDNLLELAASRDIEIQAVAAQAIASWRDQEKQAILSGGAVNLDAEEELFAILRKWQTESRVTSIISSILNQISQEESSNPLDYIRATIAITVGYAALYDSPNHLSEQLLDLFEDLSQEENKLVKNRFKQYTLPMLISKHFAQINELIQELTADQELIPIISDSIAFIYRFNIAEIDSILEKWHSACKYQYAKIASARRLGIREGSLIVIALAYSKVDYSDPLVTTDIRSIFSSLCEMLYVERHKVVRDVILKSLCRLLAADFETIVEDFKQLLPKVRQKELQLLSEEVTNIYLDQRAALTGGDGEVEIKGKKYPVWKYKRDRKSVIVEDTMLAWVKDDSDVEAQQFASQTIIEFAKRFDISEEKKAASIRDKVISPQTTNVVNDSVDTSPVMVFRPEPKAYLTKFIPWLTVREQPEYRSSVGNLLPFTFSQETLNLSATKYFLNRLADHEDQDLNLISGFLKRGLWLAKIFPFVALFLGLTSFGLVSIGMIRMGGLLNQVTNRPTPTPTETRSPSPTATPTPEPTFTPEPEPEPEPIENNPFFNMNYPKTTCGDPLPSDPALYPLNMYPVFVRYSDEKLDAIKQNFCADALRVIRKDTGIESVQVSSFVSREDAELFSDLMFYFFGSGEVGEPTVVEERR